ncbi:uncharacterized protein PRCAT00001038001 [Priceomyces carsonii]|uniref:uncharacterized protein n=1 Tax=Priceomyces carsonii TaxID=28549 RepID=UPI002ED81D91|nr:unnamed protein product [Priceomyces carsonii]
MNSKDVTLEDDDAKKKQEEEKEEEEKDTFSEVEVQPLKNNPHTNKNNDSKLLCSQQFNSEFDMEYPKRKSSSQKEDNSNHRLQQISNYKIIIAKEERRKRYNLRYNRQAANSPERDVESPRKKKRVTFEHSKSR